MTDPRTFADLEEQFREEWDEFTDQLDGACNKIVDTINGALSGFVGTVSSWMPGKNAAEEALDKWENEVYPAMREKYDEIVDQVEELVSDLAGDPMALQRYAETFVTAKKDLFRQRAYDESAAAISNSWSGAAFEAYDPVGAKQEGALELLGNALDEGGKLTSEAANKILTVWADLIDSFATFYVDLIAALSEALSVENIASLEAPVVVNLMATIASGVQGVVKVLADFMVVQATTDTVAWKSLAAGSGGLAANEWPPIPASSGRSINDRGGWTPA